MQNIINVFYANAIQFIFFYLCHMYEVYFSKILAMKNNNLFFAGIGVLILLLSSCSPVYVPNVINTPMMEQKGDGNISVNIGLSGIDGQLSYALTDNFGIMANGNFGISGYMFCCPHQVHYLVEAGTGYFGKIKENGRFEVFGGGGIGEIEVEYDFSTFESYSKVNLTRFFVQPSFGLEL